MSSAQVKLQTKSSPRSVEGAFVDFKGERFYAIENVNQMPSFFISVVSNSDHWMFIASNGGLTAGRVSPEQPLFPYIPVDKVQDSIAHTGNKTIFRIKASGQIVLWEPFAPQSSDDNFTIQRNLYKNTLGNKLCFEERNETLQLIYRYTWSSSDEYGFVLDCELENLSNQHIQVDVLDGLENIMAAGTPREIQLSASNLIDAYKWTELDEQSSLAMYTLYSGLTDKPEPFEVLRANTVFALGLTNPIIMLSSEQIDDFKAGRTISTEMQSRGIRSSYLIASTLGLSSKAVQTWRFVAEVEQTQAEIVSRIAEIHQQNDLDEKISCSVESGSDELRHIMAETDAFQATAIENVDVHHYANVLFNNMRGGVFDNQYMIDTVDLGKTIAHFNAGVFERHQAFLSDLPAVLSVTELMALAKAQGDLQLERLCFEYLPITFGRRHGDPSRPWNQFAIRLKDMDDNRLLSYEGNWRDIFQNWEALLFSYPEFIENVIAKFVNASTVDGYNPYRITKEGIDWEIEDPEDSWSYIGYWGDHQIIYLLKLLELSNNFHPKTLSTLLRRSVFSYANVPYRIKPLEAVLDDPKNTVKYDAELEKEIENRVELLGADGKLVLDNQGHVLQVNLLEKLLVPLLAKLSNFVPQGGIWLNTQRPEWNDANNALVGHGLSMVTLYYLRRYLKFLKGVLRHQDADFDCSSEVAKWLNTTNTLLCAGVAQLHNDGFDNKSRYDFLVKLGQAGSDYRQAAYTEGALSEKTSQTISVVKQLIDSALALVDDSIWCNQRTDKLFHAYNLMNREANTVEIDTLYPMLEGQVSILSADILSAAQTIDVLESLFTSDVYRADQQSFMLYPDREQTSFLKKNTIEPTQVEDISVLGEMLTAGDSRLVLQDVAGHIRFHPSLTTRDALEARIDELSEDYPSLAQAKQPVVACYEAVFAHKSFTGRSGGMFGFEGLGCIYWHMVSKLLLAVQESFFDAKERSEDEATCQKLAHLYYKVRQGIGFNKSPEAYGAFPTDPYSHTPKHAGAQQPGMTGQVKEEILTRFGELGVRVSQGIVEFEPYLLRAQEFIKTSRQFEYQDTDAQWQKIDVPPQGLAFTWCQVPVIYVLDKDVEPNIEVQHRDDVVEVFEGLALPSAISEKLFMRTGDIQKITVVINQNLVHTPLAE